MAATRFARLVTQVRDAAERSRTGALVLDGGRGCIYFLFGQPSHATFREGDTVIEGAAALRRIGLALTEPGPLTWDSRLVQTTDSLHLSSDQLVEALEALDEAHASGGAATAAPEPGPRWAGHERRRGSAVRYTVDNFPPLPTGVSVWSEVPTSMVELDAQMESLETVFVSVDGPDVRGIGIVRDGQRHDAIYIDRGGTLSGDLAWRAIVAERSPGSTISAFQISPELAEAMPVLWRGEQRFRELEIGWLDRHAFLAALTGHTGDRAVIISTPVYVGVAIFCSGRLLAGYSTDMSMPMEEMRVVRHLLTDATEGMVTVIDRTFEERAEAAERDADRRSPRAAPVPAAVAAPVAAPAPASGARRPALASPGKLAKGVRKRIAGPARAGAAAPARRQPEPVATAAAPADPVLDDQSQWQPPAEEAAAADPVLDDQSQWQPAAEEAAAADPVLDDQSQWQPPTEEAAVADPVLDDQSQWQPPAGEAAAADPVLDDQSQWQPAAEEAAVADPVLDDQSQWQPAAEEAAAAADPVLDDQSQWASVPEAAPDPVLDDQSQWQSQPQPLGEESQDWETVLGGVAPSYASGDPGESSYVDAEAQAAGGRPVWADDPWDQTSADPASPPDWGVDDPQTADPMDWMEAAIAPPGESDAQAPGTHGATEEIDDPDQAADPMDWMEAAIVAPTEPDENSQSADPGAAVDSALDDDWIIGAEESDDRPAGRAPAVAQSAFASLEERPDDLIATIGDVAASDPAATEGLLAGATDGGVRLSDLNSILEGKGSSVMPTEVQRLQSYGGSGGGSQPLFSLEARPGSSLDLGSRSVEFQPKGGNAAPVGGGLGANFGFAAEPSAGGASSSLRSVTPLGGGLSEVSSPAPRPGPGAPDVNTILSELTAIAERYLGDDFASVSYLFDHAELTVPGLRRAISTMRETPIPNRTQDEVSDAARAMLMHVAERGSGL